ncbi:MAG: hypothetical protein QM703_12315 [Gemmatales bacterium]
MQTANNWCKQHGKKKPYFDVPLIVHELPAISPYPYPGVLFWNGAGKGVLRKVEVRTGRVWNNQELVDCFIALHDKPFVFWQASGCSTCTKLIQAGCEGAEDVTQLVQLVESLIIDVFQQPAKLWIDRLLPILELLPVGYYYITLLDYYPTDGHGNFFWDAFQTMRCWNPYDWEFLKTLQQMEIPQQCDESDISIPDDPPPCYLVPSQHPSCFSFDSLGHAKERFAMHPGLALKLLDTASLLLDGHHRATAAALAGQTFSCLTIQSLGKSIHGPFNIPALMTQFQKAIQVPQQLLDWNEHLRLEVQKPLSVEEYLQRPKDQRLWHESMLDYLSKHNYPWQLPSELQLDQAVSTYPMHYRLDQAELIKRMEHFKNLLLPEHIRYDEAKTIQGIG